MSIYKNSISSIQIGIEDFRSDDERRLLSAVRNVYSGILLLGKVVLLKESPKEIGDVLIKERIVPKRNPDGSITFVGKSAKTIDREEIVNRLQAIGREIDAKRLKRIGDIRNEIEHQFTDKPAPVVREAIADSFMVIRDILAVHLDQEPSAALGAECWSVLLENHEVIKKEQEECARTLAAIDWASDTLADAVGEFRCPACSSSLVKQVDGENTDKTMAEFVCAACGEPIDGGRLIEHAIGEHLFTDAYIAMTDGGDPPVTTCPECDHDTFVLHEGKCVYCEFDTGGAECAVCGEPISVEDYAYSSDLCSYHAWVASKDRD